jgi:UrcA family protein
MHRNRCKFVTRKFALLTLAAAITGSAMAEEALTEVTVVARRDVNVEVVGRGSNGAPVELITLTRRISYADLDLSTHTGAVDLEKRVTETAQAACKELNKHYPLTVPAENPSCVKQAADGGMAQAHAAIAAAEQKARASQTAK